MPIVDRGGSRELADQQVGLLYWIDSSTSTSIVRRGGLSTSTRKRTNKWCYKAAAGALLTFRIVVFSELY